MRSLRSSAAYRIAFANFVAFAVGLALLGIVVSVAMHVAFARQLDFMMKDEAQELADEYRSGGNQNLADAISERESSGSPTRMLYAVFAPDGRRLLGGLQAERPRLGMHDISFVDPNDGPDVARALAVDLSPRERLVIAADREWLERIDETVTTVFGAAFLVACLAGLAGAWLLGGYLRRRLSGVSRTASAIIAGDISERVPVSSRADEFDQLAATLNRMLDRIENLVENLRQVSTDVAHDLRTPLARVRSRLEQAALARGEDVVVEEAIAQIDEVLSLFAAILRIAEVESGQVRRFFAPVDLSGLITDLAESYAPAIEDSGRILLWSIDPGLTVDGDRELIAQAVINLLENTQRHTPAGTIVRLTLTSVGDFASVQVSDNGPGVPKTDLGRITKRFTRLESSRGAPGYGLGLNLVSAIARLHGGRLLLRGADPGLSATFQLPRTFAARHAPLDQPEESELQ